MAAPTLATHITLDELIIRLFDIGAVKFGNFTLKSGIESPVYFDLRIIISFPKVMLQVASYLWRAADQASTFASVCGVPYTALPIATCISVGQDFPMLIRRKEAKSYGTKKLIEGRFNPGDVCLVIEDLVTSGTSVMETVQDLTSEGIVVRDAVVLLDREQGGKQRLEYQGIKLHSVCTLSKVLEVLQSAGKLDEATVKNVNKFVAENQFERSVALTLKKTSSSDVNNGSGDGQVVKRLTYSERANVCLHSLSKRLFTIMESKKTNLALAADFTNCQQILRLVDQVGDHICLVKLHVDILVDFNKQFITDLTKLADKYNFLIFEDRKFADIGNTVVHQYRDGMYNICDWAHIVNAHAVPGEGIIQGLKQVGLPLGRGCLLLAEMSSAGNLATGDYTARTVKMAADHDDFVIGFICQSKLSDDPKMIHMTPGVQLEEGQDDLGQRYLTPHEVVTKRGADIIIVGRGITKADNPVSLAQQYQTAGYDAYLERLA